MPHVTLARRPEDRDPRDAGRPMPRLVRDETSAAAPLLFAAGVAVPALLLWAGRRTEARAVAIGVAAAALVRIFRRNVRAAMVVAVAALVLLGLTVVPGASTRLPVLFIPAVVAYLFFFRRR